MITFLAIMDTAAADEVRAQVGGQLETQSHGVLDLGWRRGPWSVELLTDTLDVRVQRAGDRGRASAGFRVGVFAAGLWITPWANGAPDLGRAQVASYLGPDLEVQRYLPGGWWLGAGGFLRPHRFAPVGDASLDIPLTVWGLAQGTLGVYRRGRVLVDGRVAVGVDATSPGGWAPHLQGQASVSGTSAVAPSLSVWAGGASSQDDIVATRLGGLTPYHVPFSGASWAEFWVEDYVVGRAALAASSGPWRVEVRADAGAWTPPGRTFAEGLEPMGAVGFGLGVAWQHLGWFARAVVAHSPTLPRAEGVWPVPVWVQAGRDWRPLRAKASR